MNVVLPGAMRASVGSTEVFDDAWGAAIRAVFVARPVAAGPLRRRRSQRSRVHWAIAGMRVTQPKVIAPQPG
jgi:hypothetical protein